MSPHQRTTYPMRSLLPLLLTLLLGVSFPRSITVIATTTATATTAATTCSSQQQGYAAAANAHHPHKAPPLPGHTRSITVSNLYTLLTPSSRVYAPTSPQLSGWVGRASAAAVVTPALGAHFAMYLVEANRAASLHGAAAKPNLETFLYVLHGDIHVTRPSDSAADHVELGPGGFVYLAPRASSSADTLTLAVISDHAAFIQIERQYAGNGTPASVVGTEHSIDAEVPTGEVFRLRRLLDSTDPAYDFNIHIMDFSPGEYLNVKEVHYNQHGLLMLRGHGIYMLGDRYMPVATGDVIYMAPFVPQWYGALGTETTRYFLYKDTNIDPVLAV